MVSFRVVAEHLRSTREKSFFDDVEPLIDIPKQGSNGICRTINEIALPLSSGSWNI